MVDLWTKSQKLAKARAARIASGNLGGRKKGYRTPETIEKDKAKKALDQLYLRAQRRINHSQISIATGQTFLFKIEKKKVVGPKGGVSYENQKPVLVTSEHEIEEYLTELADNNGDVSDDSDPEAAYYFLTTKEPSNEAIKDVLNRVHGKPTETQEVNITNIYTLRTVSNHTALPVQGDVLRIITPDDANSAPDS